MITFSRNNFFGGVSVIPRIVLRLSASILGIFVIVVGLLQFSNIIQASTIYILPQSQNIYTGDTFLADVQIDTGEENINAIEGSVNFPENKLQIIDIIKGDSVVGLWIKEPDYSGKKGEISFSGGMPKGFKGHGSLFRINFKVMDSAEGLAEVIIKDNLRILLNDGKATTATVKIISGSYDIINKMQGLPAISSLSHPDSNKWYNNNTLYFHWDLKKDSIYSYSLSKDPSQEADEISDRPEGDLEWMGDIKYLDIADGIYYFHLKEKPDQGAWSRDMVFRAMIDKTSPENLTAEIAEIDGKKYAVFMADDSMSGIERYEISESDDGGYFSIVIEKEDKWRIAKNPYLLEDQKIAANIKIKSIDKAGNEKVVEIISKPQISVYAIIILIIAAFIVLFWIFIKIIRKLKHGRIK